MTQMSAGRSSWNATAPQPPAADRRGNSGCRRWRRRLRSWRIQTCSYRCDTVWHLHTMAQSTSGGYLVFLCISRTRWHHWDRRWVNWSKFCSPTRTVLSLPGRERRRGTPVSKTSYPAPPSPEISPYAWHESSSSDLEAKIQIAYACIST